MESSHRFYANDQADPIIIQQFDPTLLLGPPDESTLWIAVHRNPNYVTGTREGSPTSIQQRRQELFQAMNMATNPNTYENDTEGDDTNDDKSTTESSVLSSTVTTLKWVDTLQIIPPPTGMEAPIAVARLYLSNIGNNNNDNNNDNNTGARTTASKQMWILDSLRCSLPKELTNPECDGGSEYLEAIGVAVDASLMRIFQSSSPPLSQPKEDQQYPTTPQFVFDGSIRVKSTIYTRTVLEQRGFRPVESLSRDMATHYFCRDTCLQMYTQRIKNRPSTITSNNKSPITNDSNLLSPKDRSVSQSIVSLLQSQIEYLRTVSPVTDNSITSPKTGNGDDESGDLDELMDPWAGIKMQL